MSAMYTHTGFNNTSTAYIDIRNLEVFQKCSVTADGLFNLNECEEIYNSIGYCTYICI